MARVGYVRLPEGVRDDAQEDAVGSLVDRVYRDDGGDRDFRRPGFVRMMALLAEGDTLFVQSIGKLALTVRDLLQTVDALKAKGVRLVSIEEGIDTGADGDRASVIFSSLLQMDRAAIKDWEQDRIEAARKKEVKLSLARRR